MVENHPVLGILGRWPSRQAILEDIQRNDPSIQMVAVHRWFQRKSVPPRHWAALVNGAKRRRFKLSANGLMLAHAADGEQVGHSDQVGGSSVSVQPTIALSGKRPVNGAAR